MECYLCRETFSNDELIGFNINSEEVSLNEYDLESNAQNPNYHVKSLCIECYDNLSEKYKDKELEYIFKLKGEIIKC